MSLILNSAGNTIGDRGCRHISGEGWLQMKGVDLRIVQIISVSCGVREEGCRAMAKRKGRLEWIGCILVVNQVLTTKSERPVPASLGELLKLSIKRTPTAVPDSTQHLLPPTTLPNIQTPQPNIIRITHWVPPPQDTLPDKLLEVCTLSIPMTYFWNCSRGVQSVC